MKGQDTLFSSVKNNSKGASDDWETPDDLFNILNNEFRFTLDACAGPNNHKVDDYYSLNYNGLDQEWKDHIVWINPPYSNVKDWVSKAVDQYDKYGITVVMLLPSRTGNKEWHELISVYASQIRFLRGRLKFKGANNSAPFDSAIIVFNPKVYDERIVFMNYKN